MAYSYKPKTEPYEHQRKVLNRSWSKPYFGYFMEMGTGKSKVLIDNAAALCEQGLIQALIIVAPKGVYRNWVEREIPTHMPDRLGVHPVYWVSGKGWVGEQEEGLLSVYVMNIEALSRPGPARKELEYLVNLYPDSLLAVDESSCIKNRSAARTKAIVKIGRRVRYRRILTGTPITQSPLDLYAQCDFLDAEALPYSNFYSFRGDFAIIKRIDVGHVANIVVGYRNQEKLKRLVDRYTYRVTKDECLDLPPKIYLRREVDLTEEQKRYYKDMKELSLIKLEGEQRVSAMNILTHILRLQQIVCGYLPLDDDKGVRPIPHNRIKALQELLGELQGKTIIWCGFQHDVRAVTECLEGAVSHYGGTHPVEREATIEAFQNGRANYFVGTPSTGGYGLTLTAARNVVYYSNNYNLEYRLQSEDRAHRIGQTRSVTYVDLVSPGTVDEKILRCLREKLDLASEVLGDEVRNWL